MAIGVISTVLTISSHEYGGAPGPSVPLVNGSKSPALSGLLRSRRGRRRCTRPLSDEPNMGSILGPIPPPPSSTETGALSGTVVLGNILEPVIPPQGAPGSAAGSLFPQANAPLPDVSQLRLPSGADQPRGLVQMVLVGEAQDRMWCGQSWHIQNAGDAWQASWQPL